MSPEYQGVELRQEELAVLVELEGQIGQAIPEVGKLEWDTLGFVTSHGRMTGLGLYQSGLRYLPEKIGELKSLGILGLNGNQIATLVIAANQSDAATKTVKDTCRNCNGKGNIECPTCDGSGTLAKCGMNSNQCTPSTYAYCDGDCGGISCTLCNGSKVVQCDACNGRGWNIKMFDGNGYQLATIGDLKSLTSIDLSNNSLTSLPETIGELACLTWLDLSNNSLTSLPETIGELKSLKWYRGCS